MRIVFDPFYVNQSFPHLPGVVFNNIMVGELQEW